MFFSRVNRVSPSKIAVSWKYPQRRQSACKLTPIRPPQARRPSRPRRRTLKGDLGPRVDFLWCSKIKNRTKNTHALFQPELGDLPAEAPPRRNQWIGGSRLPPLAFHLYWNGVSNLSRSRNWTNLAIKKKKWINAVSLRRIGIHINRLSTVFIVIHFNQLWCFAADPRARVKPELELYWTLREIGLAAGEKL